MLEPIELKISQFCCCFAAPPAIKIFGMGRVRGGSEGSYLARPVSPAGLNFEFFEAYKGGRAPKILSRSLHFAALNLPCFIHYFQWIYKTNFKSYTYKVN